MRPSIRAIVMDMDGTLLDERSEIAAPTRQALLDLEKQGVRLVLASGRSYTRLLKYASQLGMEDYDGCLIEVDGIALYECASKVRTKYRELSPDEIRPVFAWLIGQIAESQAMMDDAVYDFYPPALQPVKEALRKELGVDDDFPWTAGPWSWLCDFRDGYPEIRYIHSADELDRPINKIQIMQEEAPLQQLYRQLEERFGERFSIYRTTPRQLEILPHGFSKGIGLRRLMEKNGWSPQEVLVFGDGENDCSMFEEVTQSFAMANAKDYVAQRASAIAGDHADNGILDGLEQAGLLCKADYVEAVKGGRKPRKEN